LHIRHSHAGSLN